MADNRNSPSAEHNDQNFRIVGKWARFSCYGLLGWCFEIVWTALADKITGNAQGWDLTGHSYLWMFPIYGLAAWLYEPAHNRLRKQFFLIRACIYAAGIMAVEYITGGLILLVTGHCPWDYSQIAYCHIHGLVRLEAFPVWAAVGLALEPIHDFLVRLTPAVLSKLKSKKIPHE